MTQISVLAKKNESESKEKLYSAGSSVSEKKEEEKK